MVYNYVSMNCTWPICFAFQSASCSSA